MTEYLFITGRLAADFLQSIMERMNPEFTFKLKVLNITVAALMNTVWIAEHLPAGAHGCDKVIIPGSCKGNLSVIETKTGVSVVRGPKDLKDLPFFFGSQANRQGYGKYQTKILAEITDAYQMPADRILDTAYYFRRSGADIIDLGCPAQETFHGVEYIVKKLKKRGFTVSLDSFDPDTILSADNAGIDLLLSVNSQNIHLISRLKCKVVVIPDFGKGLDSLLSNAEKLDKAGITYIMDPILDPIGFGFAASLQRYFDLRLQRPRAEILMGIANLIELTDADSLGVNAVMAGIINEISINYVLTTEVISWARGAVREFDLARKLMFYAGENNSLPKHIDDRLITIKDPPYEEYTEFELRCMQQKLKDSNYRIFTGDSRVFVLNRDVFVSGSRPDEIFNQLTLSDNSHSFYLGRELERAFLALRLKKRYSQDEDLRWGYLNENMQYPE